MGDPKEHSIGGGGSLSNAVRPVRICVCVHRHHVWQMMRFAWDNERFLSFLVLFLFPRSCTHSAGTMFLNVPSGLRPELIYMHESVSRLCRGHAYFLESLLDLRFFGISFILLTALVHKHQTVASLKVSAIIAITPSNTRTSYAKTNKMWSGANTRLAAIQWVWRCIVVWHNLFAACLCILLQPLLCQCRHLIEN